MSHNNNNKYKLSSSQQQSQQRKRKRKKQKRGRILVWFLLILFAIYVTISFHLIIWTTTATTNIDTDNNNNNNNDPQSTRRSSKGEKLRTTTTTRSSNRRGRERERGSIIPPKMIIPPKKGLLFEERLDYALNNLLLLNNNDNNNKPSSYNYLSVQDVEFIEHIVFDNYYVPYPVTLLWPEEELPLDYRYPKSTKEQCGSNCNLITLPPPPPADSNINNNNDTTDTYIKKNNNKVVQFLLSQSQSQQSSKSKSNNNNSNIIDGLLQAIQYRKIAKYFNISSLCWCGEAKTGTGRICFQNIQQCTYQHSFKRTDPIWTSYSRLQFLPEYYNITTISKVVEQMLIPYPHHPQDNIKSSPLVAMHSNCFGSSGRGRILMKINDLDNQQLLYYYEKMKHNNDTTTTTNNNNTFTSSFVPILHSYGKCWNNQDIFQYEPRTRDLWHWKDSEGNRDTTKTDISSRYKITAAMENTIDDIDYFTEKRFQALVSGSVPLLFRKPAPYSERYLPHPDSAIFVDDYNTTEQLYNYLRELSNNDTLYYENHQRWKEVDGVSKEFVKILFHGYNFLPCRACELIAKEKEAKAAKAAAEKSNNDNN